MSVWEIILRPITSWPYWVFWIWCMRIDWIYDGPSLLDHQIWPWAIWHFDMWRSMVHYAPGSACDYLKKKYIEKVEDLGFEPRSWSDTLARLPLHCFDSIVSKIQRNYNINKTNYMPENKNARKFEKGQSKEDTISSLSSGLEQSYLRIWIHN